MVDYLIGLVFRYVKAGLVVRCSAQAQRDFLEAHKYGLINLTKEDYNRLGEDGQVIVLVLRLEECEYTRKAIEHIARHITKAWPEWYK